MRKILVTGGCGMIGSNLVKRLAGEGEDVYVIDNLWRGRLENLCDGSGRPVIDLGTRFQCRDLAVPGQADAFVFSVDYVVHLADVVAGIGYVFGNQGELFRVNSLVNTNVFHSVRKAGRSRIRGLLYVGTACSYPLTRQDTPDAAPLREEELFPAMPESAYGWSKLAGQLEVGYLERETGIPCCTLQFHNVYGTPCDYGERGQVIPSLIRKAVNYPLEPYTVWGSGSQGRAFLHVDDAVEALCLALERGWGHGWIQVGPSSCTSIREVAEAVARISGKGMDISYDTFRPEGDKSRCADYSKAREVLGWEPRVTLEEGLRGQYEWIARRMASEAARGGARA